MNRQPPNQFSPLTRQVATMEQPSQQVTRMDRDAVHAPQMQSGREVSYKPWRLQSLGTYAGFSVETAIASLSHPHSAVDAYVSIESIDGSTTFPTSSALPFEVAATLYAVVGATRSRVARGAYVLASGAPITLLRNLWLIAARVGAERYDMTLRVSALRGGDLGTPILVTGNVSIIGYESTAVAGHPIYARVNSGASAAVGLAPIGRALDFIGFTVSNTGGAATNLQFFDTATAGIIPNGTAPIDSFLVPAGATISFAYPEGPLPFTSGLVWQASSTAGIMTLAAGATLNVSLQYQ